MDKKNEEFLKRLLATFKIEAQEHVNALSSGLIELEKAKAADEQLKAIEIIFREAHSLKGAARAVNLTDVETLCQSLESVFAALRKQEIATSTGMFDLLHEAIGTLEKLLKVPYFAEAWSEETNPARYADLAPTVFTTRQFSEATEKMIDFVRERIATVRGGPRQT